MLFILLFLVRRRCFWLFLICLDPDTFSFGGEKVRGSLWEVDLTSEWIELECALSFLRLLFMGIEGKESLARTLMPRPTSLH